MGTSDAAANLCENPAMPDPRAAPLPHTCVIGAGPSGLPVIKALRDRGLPVTCFERTPNVGGLWCIDNKRFGTSAAYDSLHINTDTKLMEYQDFPMPEDLPAYPGHRQIHEYFRAYVERFGLAGHIRFGATVERCRRLEDGRWQVALAEGETQVFDALVVATGHHWDPQGPDPVPPGTFEGVQIHSHAYCNPTDPVEMRGKRVVVVGLGNSAVDIASELGSRAVAERVFLSVRRGAWILPKWVAGTPITRLPEPQRLFPWMPWQVTSLVMGLVMRLQFGKPSDYGLPMPDHRPLQSHPTVSQDLLSRIGHGDIAVRPPIRSLDGDGVVFTDGSRECVDVIIWCTGYRVSFPFLGPEVVEVRDNVVPLWSRTVLPGVDNLFFVGLYQPLGSIMQPAELQARVIGEYLLGHIAFPNEARMRRDIEAEQRAMARRYLRSRRHTMQVDFGPFMHRLRRLLAQGRRELGRPGAMRFAVRPRAALELQERPS
jgi:cation diffusion facilitator CzcD-associated flavoprotein CzcO